jgi:phospholipase/carboxylesterase
VTTPLETVEIETGPAPKASIVWLHGLGADGHDFEPIVPELAIAGLPLRFVFPHAPSRPVTLNGGMSMPAWFDVLGLERGTVQDERGIREMEERVRELIRRENDRGVPSHRILLVGFSQGGALALHTGLRYPERLGGLVGLSTFLPLDWTVAGEAHAANRRTPVFLAHGSHDPLVAPELGAAGRDLLARHGYDVAWRTYPMPHAVCAEEIADIRAWIAIKMQGSDPAAGSDPVPLAGV